MTFFSACRSGGGLPSIWRGAIWQKSPSRWGTVLLMLLLLSSADARRAWAQTLTVPLGTAGQFGLLSGGTLRTDSATAVRVAGRAGAASAITGPITADGGLYRPTAGGSPNATTVAALTDLATARAWCASQTSQPLTSLNGQTLTGGVYTLTGTTTLAAANPLTLSGPAGTTFVVTVTGALTLAPGAVVRLTGGVTGASVYWNIGGTLTASRSGGLPGYVLVGGHATLAQGWPTRSAVLSQGNITLQNARFEPVDGGGVFFASPASNPVCTPSAAIVNTAPCPNLVDNGDFERAFPGLIAPTQLSNICDHAGTANAGNTRNELAAWGSANEGTPDWFRTGAPNEVNVPVNARNDLFMTPPNTQNPAPIRLNGLAYAGVWATADLDNGADAAPTMYREYLQQELATPLTARHYYAEFFSRVAFNSNGVIRRLGLTVLPTAPARQGNGLLLDAANVPLMPLVTNLAPNPQLNLNWTRTAGCFQATGGERSLIIGNFDDLLASRYTSRVPAWHQEFYSDRLLACFTYIDDVLLQAFPQAIVFVPTFCDRLTVDCPLPASSNANYIWHDLTANIPYPPSTNPVFVLPAGAIGHTFEVTINVPPADPQGAAYPPVTLPAVSTGGYDIANGLTVLTGTTITWNATPAPRTVRGPVVVQDGATLIIDGATVRFADTRTYQTTLTATPTNPTYVLVERGGKLVVRNGARLTSLDNLPAGPCLKPHYYWDGIIVQGNPAAAQQAPSEPGPQGQVEIRNATVENAYYGILAGNLTYVTGQATPAISGYNQYGGGLVTGRDATFHNCNIGVYLGPFAGPVTPTDQPMNLSSLDFCTFRRDANWQPRTYVLNTTPTTTTTVTTAVPQQTAWGVALYGVNRPRLMGNLFETTDALADAGGNRGSGIVTNGANTRIESGPSNRFPNVFRNLGVGVGGTGSMSTSLRVQGNQFEGCGRGINLSGVPGAELLENHFLIGRGTDSYASGISLSGCAGFKIEGNTFSAKHGGCNNGQCINARGITVSGSDGFGIGLGHTLYRNYFAYLSEGVRAGQGNTELELRCNHFATTDPGDVVAQTPNFAPGTITGADIVVQPVDNVGDPLKAEQGECDEIHPEKAANNVFSHTRALHGYGNDFYVYTYPYTGAAPVYGKSRYNYLDDGNNGGTITTAGTKPLNSSVRILLNACTGFTTGFDYTTACPSQLQRPLSDEEMIAELATETNPEVQEALVSELVRHYLNDTTYTNGPAQAVALLEATNAPRHTELVAALSFDPDAANLSRAAPGQPKGRAGKVAKRDQVAATVRPAQRGAPAGTYFAQVRALLAPLGSDSAITVALRADSSLRAPLWRIANDTLTWGYVAGRAALSYYCGYVFRPVQETALDTTGGYNRAVAPVVQPLPAKVAGTVQLHPNPANGRVEVTFAQPVTSGGRLVLYNPYGQPVRELTLRSKTETGTAELDVAGLQPGLYYYIHWAGGQKGQTGTLVVQP